ncbi:MAG: M15 family metallopeptidase [Actinomycetota bacterium]
MRRLALMLALAVAVAAGAGCSAAPAAAPVPSSSPRRGPTGAEPVAASPAPSASAPRSASPAPERSSDAFEGEVSRIGPFLRERLVGRNWRPGCPVGIEDLRHVEVSYRDFTGHVRSGPLIVHEMVAEDILSVFRRLFRAGFQIHRIKLPPRYRPPTSDDWTNTRNRTAAFNCRPATGNPGSLSHHSYGWAIDINPLQNPYVGPDGSVLRRAAKPYTDRALREPGMVRPGDVVVRSFERIGWEWGGDWITLKDYMHFSLTGR